MVLDLVIYHIPDLVITRFHHSLSLALLSPSPKSICWVIGTKFIASCASTQWTTMDIISFWLLWIAVNEECMSGRACPARLHRYKHINGIQSAWFPVAYCPEAHPLRSNMTWCERSNSSMSCGPSKITIWSLRPKSHQYISMSGS